LSNEKGVGVWDGVAVSVGVGVQVEVTVGSGVKVAVGSGSGTGVRADDSSVGVEVGAAGRGVGDEGDVGTAVGSMKTYEEQLTINNTPTTAPRMIKIKTGTNFRARNILLPRRFG
jgi:hypothetical protein